MFNFNHFRDVTVASPTLSTSMPGVSDPGQRPGPNAPPRPSIAGSIAGDSFNGDDPRNLLNSINYRNQNC